jgi:hypothetical protein
MRGKYGHFTGAHGPGSCDAAAAPGEHVAGGWSSHGGGAPGAGGRAGRLWGRQLHIGAAPVQMYYSRHKRCSIELSFGVAQNIPYRGAQSPLRGRRFDSSASV